MGVKPGTSHWVREFHRLRRLDNRVLRKTFGPQRGEETAEWRRLHKEELYDLYFSQNITRGIELRRMRWAAHVACTGNRKVAYSVLVGKPEGQRQHGRPRPRWEDNIKVDLEMG
jgi:hypothetical protein